MFVGLLHLKRPRAFAQTVPWSAQQSGTPLSRPTQPKMDTSTTRRLGVSHTQQLATVDTKSEACEKFSDPGPEVAKRNLMLKGNTLIGSAVSGVTTDELSRQRAIIGFTTDALSEAAQLSEQVSKTVRARAEAAVPHGSGRPVEMPTFTRDPSTATDPAKSMHRLSELRFVDLASERLGISNDVSQRESKTACIDRKDTIRNVLGWNSVQRSLH